MNGSTTTALRLVPAPVDQPAVNLLPEVHAEPVTQSSERISAAGGRVRLHLAPERGMATAEYAVGIVAACAFAMLLYGIIKTGPVLGLLTALINGALAIVGR